MELKDLKLTEKRVNICEKLDLRTSEDIVRYYPFRYENIVEKHYKDFYEGAEVCFSAEVLTQPSTFRYGKRSTTRFKVLYEDEELSVTIFNRPWIRGLNINDHVVIIGKYDGKNKVTATNYYTKNINEVTGIIPVYSTKEGISQNDIRKLIEYTRKKADISDDLPSYLIEEHKLIGLKEAIDNIHLPANEMLLKLSLARLKYEEFLRFYVALDILKGNSVEKFKEEKKFARSDVDRLISSFPYVLTDDQEKAVNDILDDLSSNKTMYRLIQGEVGSGKTAVAVVGLYANYLSGFSGALMAPTEILAKQHYASIKEMLEPFGVRVGILYSQMENERKVKEELKNGNIDVIVGTHALFSKDVEIRKLGMVIADEQHRFGVKQRKALKEKGEKVDFALMSATPIPRTLASSIYGDMDVSTIATLPSNRKPAETVLIRKNSISDILGDLKERLAEGRQIYIVAAAIEKNENYKAKDITNLYNSLISVFAPYRLSLLHGRMSSEEKDRVMDDFNCNRSQILISTTVVEVGVNVKNATVMVIYDADKFGLSQIHQLRGRIRRGEHKGYCYLLTDSREKSVIDRLNILVNNDDGFKISMEDLKIRGPGDILGTRQSGLPAFVLGNIVDDTKFIDAARTDARRITENLDIKENRRYYDQIKEIADKTYVD